MAQHNTFNHKNSKLNYLWSKTEEQRNKLEEVPVTTLNFNSINFNKKIITIPILTDKVLGYYDRIQTVLLENFPEDMLNMLEVNTIYSVGDGFASQFANGNTYITHQECNYWFNRIDQRHFFLKIFFRVSIRHKGAVIPVTANTSLKIYNQRIYETRK